MKSLLFVTLVAVVGCSQKEGPAVFADPVLERGRKMYGAACAPCHGERGDGNGPVSRQQPRRPRSFLGEAFLTAPAGQVPSDDRLAEVLKRGLPESSMPSFEWMPEEDRRAVIRYVRREFLDRRGGAR